MNSTNHSHINLNRGKVYWKLIALLGQTQSLTRRCQPWEPPSVWVTHLREEIVLTTRELCYHLSWCEMVATLSICLSRESWARRHKWTKKPARQPWMSWTWLSIPDLVSSSTSTLCPVRERTAINWLSKDKDRINITATTTSISPLKSAEQSLNLTCLTAKRKLKYSKIYWEKIKFLTTRYLKSN